MRWTLHGRNSFTNGATAKRYDCWNSLGPPALQADRSIADAFWKEDRKQLSER